MSKLMLYGASSSIRRTAATPKKPAQQDETCLSDAEAREFDNAIEGRCVPPLCGYSFSIDRMRFYHVVVHVCEMLFLDGCNNEQ